MKLAAGLALATKNTLKIINKIVSKGYFIIISGVKAARRKRRNF